MNGTGVDRGTVILRTDARPWGDVVWLAGHDIRRTWPAYPASAVYLAFFGFLIAVSNIDPGTYAFEFMSFGLWMIMATPFFAREYMSWSTDPIAERLSWLRVLPIGVSTIVRARALAILVALPLNAGLFFLPIWLGDRMGLSTGDLFWFGVVLAGTSLVGAGMTLALEMSVSIRRWILINLVVMAVVFVLMLVLGLVFDVRLFEQLLRATQWNGPVMGVACVVVGAGIFTWCVRLAEDGLRRREITP